MVKEQSSSIIGEVKQIERHELMREELVQWDEYINNLLQLQYASYDHIPNEFNDPNADVLDALNESDTFDNPLKAAMPEDAVSLGDYMMATTGQTLVNNTDVLHFLEYKKSISIMLRNVVKMAHTPSGLLSEYIQKEVDSVERYLKDTKIPSTHTKETLLQSAILTVLTRGTTQLSPSFKSELLSLFFNNPGIAVHTPEDFFSNFNPSGNEEQILSQLQAEIKSGDINTQAQHFPMILYLKALGIPVESLSGINELKKSQHTRYMKALSGNIPSVRTTHYPQSNLDYFNQLPQSFFLNVQAYTDELLTSPQKSTRKQASVVEAVESKEQEISLNRESAEALFKELQKYFDHDQLAELLMLDPLAIRKTDLSVEELENFASHILDALSWAYTTTGVHRANNEDIDQTNAPFTHEDVAVILSRILTARSKNTVEEWQKFTEKSLGPFKTRLQII